MTIQRRNYEFLVHKYTIETANVERYSILSGLACAQDDGLIKECVVTITKSPLVYLFAYIYRFINDTINGVIDDAQIMYAYRFIPFNPAANHVAWDFISNDWPKLLTRYY